LDGALGSGRPPAEEAAVVGRRAHQPVTMLTTEGVGGDRVAEHVVIVGP